MKKAAAAPKPGAKKAKPKPWAPVSVATQRARHQAANKKWKPVPVAVQRARHLAAAAAAANLAAAKAQAPAKGKTAKGKAPAVTHAKTVRKLALGDGVACCAAAAVAASLRLTGRPVSDRDVLALYRRTAGGPDAGASILATLEAACEYGLAGVRLARYDLYTWDAAVLAERYVLGIDDLDAAAFAIEASAFPPAEGEPVLHRPMGQALDGGGHALILGVDLPGPHAVLAAPEGWWSWGELYDPGCWPDAVIEEAWTLAWD